MTKPTQLTIEHLSAYLPYGVKVKSIDIFIGDPVFTLGVETISGTHAGMNWVLSDSFKPILRPLSQLTVLITHNGEMFVPIEWIRQEWQQEHLIGFVDPHCDWDVIRIAITTNGWCSEFPYWVSERLRLWHFDVFGLIEAGLAVAMNPDGTLAQ